MEINLLTPDDLETFKKQLLEEMQKSFQHFNTPPMPQLLKAKAFVIAALYISQAVADMAAAYTDCCGFA